MNGNLPDDFSWREFDAHFGDDQRPETDEADFDPTPEDMHPLGLGARVRFDWMDED